MYIFIINPAAGHGKAKRVFEALTNSKPYQQINSIYYYTRYEGHAEIIAEQIASKYRQTKKLQAVIVIGGDGTFHEVVNGIASANIPLGFIPGGSGNDFARGACIKGRPEEILQRIIQSDSSKTYWLGQYAVENKEMRCFVNSIGFGFDAEIAQNANQSLYKKGLNAFRFGSLSYIFALIKVLFFFKPFTVTIEIDGKVREIERCWMVSVANHPFYGGGMKVIPTAKIQPNVLPLIIIHGVSKWKILGLFLTVFTGKHTQFKEVELLESHKVKITSTEPLYYQVDGSTNTCLTSLIMKKAHSIQIKGT
ncbi:MAG TPA: diacylglycerol kinase family protein [Bacillota bacterium]|nr:diacylglycerol kinase family protein [Bacillota bacterium]